jgi:hypothetical protein
MRTIYPMVLVMALGTAGMMWSMMGAGQILSDSGDSGIDNLESTDKLEEQGQELKDEEDEEEDNGGFFSAIIQGVEDSIFGLVLSAAQRIVSFAKLALLLPLELQRLGLPRGMAYPLGLAAQAVSLIGFLQFAAGRTLE